MDMFSVLGMKYNPFSAAVDEKNYYHTSTTKIVLSEFMEAIHKRQGFIVLSGDVGVGKTSLLLQLFPRLERQNVVTSLIINSLLTREELLTSICQDFGLNISYDLNFSRLLNILHKFFLKKNKEGKNCVIIIDEAHNLSVNVLESLRMLSNLETRGKKLVQIILVGQQELMDQFKRKELRQLKSRIGLVQHLYPLTRQEQEDYVKFKLASSGSQVRITSGAMKLLWITTLGNLRLINVVMERSLHALVVFNKMIIDKQILKSALKDIAKYRSEVLRRLRLVWTKRLAYICLPIVLTCTTSFFLLFSQNLFISASSSPLNKDGGKVVSSETGHPDNYSRNKSSERVQGPEEDSSNKAALSKKRNKGQSMDKGNVSLPKQDSETESKSKDFWFIVQISVYSQKNKAIQKLSSLQEKDIEACFLPVWDTEGNKWYMVEAGLASKEKNAQAMAQKCQSVLDHDISVIRLEKSMVEKNLQCL